MDEFAPWFLANLDEIALRFVAGCFVLLLIHRTIAWFRAENPPPFAHEFANVLKRALESALIVASGVFLCAAWDPSMFAAWLTDHPDLKMRLSFGAAWLLMLVFSVWTVFELENLDVHLIIRDTAQRVWQKIRGS